MNATTVNPELSLARGAGIDKIAAEISRMEAGKIDVLAVPSNSVRMHPSAGSEDVLTSIKGTDLGFMPGTRNFHVQVAEKLNIPFQYYARAFAASPDFLSETANFWLERSEFPRLVRTVDGTARAFLSDSYKIVDHHTVFAAAADAFSQRGAEIHRASLGESAMYLAATIPNPVPVEGRRKVGDVLHFGAIVKNSETGHASVGVRLYARVLSCENGMTFGRTIGGYSRNHSGAKITVDGDLVLSREAIEADARAMGLAIRDAILCHLEPEALEAAVEKVRRSMNAELDSSEQVAAVPRVLQSRYALTEKEANAALGHFATGGTLTQWGLVQAITRLGHDAPSFERRVELEETGGNAVADDWEAILRELRA